MRQGLHWAPLLGFGMTVAEFDQKVGREVGRLNHVLQIPSVIVLQEYGFTVTKISMRQEPVVFDVPVPCPQLETEYAAGICVGTRILIDVETKQGVGAHSQFEYRVFKPGEIEEGTWKINGVPGMQIKVIREDTGVASGTSLINRVPDVINARPGIVTIMEMGPEKHSVFL
jgi:4-hydroxy-tetrahydrodipicolinate reductase